MYLLCPIKTILAGSKVEIQGPTKDIGRFV